MIQLDILPTALVAAGVEIRADWKLDGVDLVPHLKGEKSAPPHAALYWRFGKQIAIRKGDWKLVKAPGGGANFDEATAGATTEGAQLYNLAKDIGEATNLAAQEPDKVRELAADWQKWNAELAAPAWHPVRSAADRARIQAMSESLAEPGPAAGNRPGR